MAKLKVIRAKHEDDERQGRMHLDTLGEPFAAIAAGFEWIVPNCAATI